MSELVCSGVVGVATEGRQPTLLSGTVDRCPCSVDLLCCHGVRQRQIVCSVSLMLSLLLWRSPAEHSVGHPVFACFLIYDTE